MASAPPAAKRRKSEPNTVLLENSEKCAFSGNTKEAVSGKELWLMAVPWELDVRSLDGKKLHLGSPSVFKVDDNKLSAQYTTSPHCYQEGTCFSFLPVGDKPGRVKIGPPLKGELPIHRTVAIPEVQLPPPTEKNLELPSGLRQRWKPFGWRNPVTQNRTDAKTKKKKSRKATKI